MRLSYWLHDWRTRHLTRVEAMRRLCQSSSRSRLRVIYAEPKWSKFVLLTDAYGNSLMRRAWSRLRKVS
jgi:hypothetical protein